MEEEMVSQKTMLIAALVATLAVLVIVMSISVVLGLLTTSKTVPSSGTIQLVAWVFRQSLPT
jgi:hypothetical protein